ncbi:hypothetical protein GCM10012279_18650 [Micromonospora yangpuensis]|nr:hypothetical protein GCM10012279_18650 [Micromonospora yangpuensis]
MRRLGSCWVLNRVVNRGRSLTSIGASAIARCIGGRARQAGSTGTRSTVPVGAAPDRVGSVADRARSPEGSAAAPDGSATRDRVPATSRRILSRSPMAPH